MLGIFKMSDTIDTTGGSDCNEKKTHAAIVCEFGDVYDVCMWLAKLQAHCSEKKQEIEESI